MTGATGITFRVESPCRADLAGGTLDIWPLGRWQGKESARRLIVEKLPLFGLTVVATAVGVVAQRSAAAVASTSDIGIASRVQNAAAGYMDYLLQTVWPVGLAYYYPHPSLIGDGGLSPLKVALSCRANSPSL